MSEIKFALTHIETPPFAKTQIEDIVESLPPHIKPLGSQVAGHLYAILQDQTTGNIMKPLFDDRSVREEVFYKLLFDPKFDTDSSLAKLRSFMPKYIGTVLMNEVQFLTLTDLTKNAINPSLMDIKMGFVVYDRHATDEKIMRESTKDHLSRALGFRILAFTKWIDKTKNYDKIDREYCRTCTVDQEIELIKRFVRQPDKAKTVELIKSITDQLEKIKDWFEKDNIDLFEFISSSIFFIYSYHNGQLDCRLKMIDFAHVYPLEGSKVNLSDNKKDENYLLGLNKLIELIEKQLD